MTLQYPDTCLLIFARAPIPGQVKTRLIPALGEQGACEFYQDMLIDIVGRVASSQLCHIRLLCQPDTGHPLFERVARDFGLQLVAQKGSDLGERMQQAIGAALFDFNKAIVIGTDCPQYSAGYIDEAICWLERKDIVLGPARDGGYVLLGVKHNEPHIFNQVEWGQASVFDKTISNLQETRLKFHCLEALYDIDTPEDLAHLCKTIPYKK